MSGFITKDEVVEGNAVPRAIASAPPGTYNFTSSRLVETHHVKQNIAMVYEITIPEEGLAVDKSGKKQETPEGKKAATKSVSYCLWRSRNVAGFTLNQVVDNPFNEKFRVKPFERFNGLVSPVESTIFGQMLKRPSNERQVLCFKQGNVELFRADFVPFSTAAVRRMFVSMPNVDKVLVRIGCIEWTASLGIRNNALIMDCINNQGFATRTVRSESYNRVEIIRKGGPGKVAAVMSAAASTVKRNNNYHIAFATDTTTDDSWETKVLLLCVLVMWSVTRYEGNENVTLKSELCEFILCILLLLAFVGFFIGVWYY